MADTHDYEHSAAAVDTVEVTTHDGRRTEIELPAGGFTPRTQPTVLQPASITAASVDTPEPARKVGALGSVISAVLGVVVYYGLNVPPDAEKLLLTFFAGMAILWPALLETVRGKVAPIEKAQALIDAAYQMDPNDPRTVKPSIT